MSFLIFIAIACGNPPTTTVEEILPNTPETVAQKWLEDYYNNRFVEAKALSTAATRTMIDTISQVIITEMEETVAFKITNLICTTEADTARCSYLYHEGDMETEENLLLLRQQGQWLVNAELLSGDDLQEGDVEELFNHFEERFDEAIDRN